MKKPTEIFKEVLEELGFARYKPDQMSNSDYWMCTCTAMERYADEQSQKTLEDVKELIEKYLKYGDGYFENKIMFFDDLEKLKL